MYINKPLSFFRVLNLLVTSHRYVCDLPTHVGAAIGLLRKASCDIRVPKCWKILRNYKIVIKPIYNFNYSNAHVLVLNGFELHRFSIGRKQIPFIKV